MNGKAGPSIIGGAPNRLKRAEGDMNGNIRIDREICCVCGGCVGICPAEALILTHAGLHLDEAACTACGLCVAFCPVRAVSRTSDKTCSTSAETIDTDVVVVGAGPAGSVCAERLARSGIRTVVVEKRQEIGAPKRCAEGISSQTFKDLKMEVDPRWVAARIQSAVLHAPDGTAVRWTSRSQEDWGYILERKVFEKHLARNAVLAGARYLIQTEAVGVIRDHGTVAGVEFRSCGKKGFITARIVIAADGPDSMIAKWAGLDSRNRQETYISGIQYEMAGLRHIDETAIHLYFGNGIAPGGYAWIFPKGRSMANVGLGIKTDKSKGKSAKDFLDMFIRDRPDIFERASAVEINCGGVPTDGSIPALAGDGLLIVGDAGHLVNPATGGGMKLAMMSGRMAAEVAADAVRKNSVTRESLSRYEKLWKAQHGRKTARMLKLNTFHESLSDKDLNRLARLISGETLDDLSRGSFAGMTKILTKNAPDLARYAVKYLMS